MRGIHTDFSHPLQTRHVTLILNLVQSRVLLRPEPSHQTPTRSPHYHSESIELELAYGCQVNRVGRINNHPLSQFRTHFDYTDAAERKSALPGSTERPIGYTNLIIPLPG